MKLTDWFPPHVKPVRVGVYEVKREPKYPQIFKRWAGSYWEFEMGGYWAISCFQSEEWRGLAEPPK